MTSYPWKTVQTLSFHQLSTVSTVEKFLPTSWAQRLPSIHIILPDLLPCAAVPWPMPLAGHYATSCQNLALWRWQDREAQIPRLKGWIFWLETVDLRTSKKNDGTSAEINLHKNPRSSGGSFGISGVQGELFSEVSFWSGELGSDLENMPTTGWRGMYRWGNMATWVQ